MAAAAPYPYLPDVLVMGFGCRSRVGAASEPRPSKIGCLTRSSPSPRERKEPLTDARHVRNAIAPFDQVEGVSDADRDRAWKRILAAAERYNVEVSASIWRDLAKGGKDRKR
jgi:hypothetical protein